MEKQKLQRVVPDRRYTTIMCRKCVFKTYVTLCSWTSRPPRHARVPVSVSVAAALCTDHGVGQKSLGATKFV